LGVQGVDSEQEIVLRKGVIILRILYRSLYIFN